MSIKFRNNLTPFSEGKLSKYVIRLQLNIKTISKASFTNKKDLTKYVNRVKKDKSVLNYYIYTLQPGGMYNREDFSN